VPPRAGADVAGADIGVNRLMGSSTGPAGSGPTTGRPAADVATTHQILDSLGSPAVLVGHSFEGALASITAFAADKGESVNSLIAEPPPGPPGPLIPPILPPSKDGFLFLDRHVRRRAHRRAHRLVRR